MGGALSQTDESAVDEIVGGMLRGIDGGVASGIRLVKKGEGASFATFPPGRPSPFSHVFHVDLEDASGDAIASFEADKFINGGCFGHMYLISCTNTECEQFGKGQFYGLKLLHQHDDDASVYGKLFARPGFFKHQSVTQVLSMSSEPLYKVSGGRKVPSTKYAFGWSIQQFNEGGNIFEVLQCGMGMKDKKIGASEDFVRHYILELLEVIRHCHNYGFVHRDIKLDNVMLDGYGNTKLIDFGEGKVFDTPVLEAFTSSPRICAHVPEECQSASMYAPEKVDTWSIGVFAFKMMMLKNPFDPSDGNWLDKSMLNLLDGRHNKKFWDYWETYVQNYIKWASSPGNESWTGFFRLPSPKFKSWCNKIFTLDPSDRCGIDDLIEDPWIKDYMDNPVFKDSANLSKEMIARGRDPVEPAPSTDYGFSCIGVDSPKTMTGKLSVDFTLPAAIGNNAGEAKEWMLENVLSLLARFNEQVDVKETKKGIHVVVKDKEGASVIFDGEVMIDRIDLEPDGSFTGSVGMKRWLGDPLLQMTMLFDTVKMKLPDLAEAAASNITLIRGDGK